MCIRDSHRSAELRALATRKYLDALCVFSWAVTQLLLSATTFGLMALLGEPLRCVQAQQRWRQCGSSGNDKTDTVCVC